VTRTEEIIMWFQRWATLRAWRQDLSDVAVKVSDRIHDNRLGTAWPRQRKIAIYRHPSFTDELDTLVHELAHIATTHEHDERWQTTYAAAITEITNIDVTPVAYNYRILSRAGCDTLKAWWRMSGNEQLRTFMLRNRRQA
jgi:hypothetical protein